MEHSFQNSTIAQIIDAIINQLSFEGESNSDISDILLSILNQTPYEKEPNSVIAELFIKLKSKIEGESFEPFDKSYLGNIAEIIKSILDETEYNKTPNSRIAELLLELKAELEEYVEKTASGALANFTTSFALPLVNCEVDENATKIYQRGANLWDEQTETGNLDDNGLPTADDNRLRSVNFCPIKESINVYVTKGGSGNINIFFYDINKDYITRTGWNAGNSTRQIPSGACYFKIVLATQYGTTYNDDVGLMFPSSDTEYHAYNSSSDDYDVADIGNINTFVGVNNIFTDNGDVAVTYKANKTD